MSRQHLLPNSEYVQIPKKAVILYCIAKDDYLIINGLTTERYECITILETVTDIYFIKGSISMTYGRFINVLYDNIIDKFEAKDKIKWRLVSTNPIIHFSTHYISEFIANRNSITVNGQKFEFKVPRSYIKYINGTRYGFIHFMGEDQDNEFLSIQYRDIKEHYLDYEKQNWK